MIELLLIVAALGLVGAAAYLIYARWFVRAAAAELPRVAVKRLPYEEPGMARFELTLRATRRAFECVRLAADHTAVEAVGLEAPLGFVTEQAFELAAEQVYWVPEPPGLILHPKEPVEIVVPFAPGREATGVVHGWCDAPFGLGGSILPFKLIVGEQSARDIEAANLRAELFARAAELGVVPNTLPEWAQLEDLERERNS
jgi:hypothetical protein